MTIDTLPAASPGRAWSESTPATRRARKAERRATERVGATGKVPVLLRAFGVEPAEAFDAAGLALECCEDPDNRMAIDDVGRLLEVCTARTGCDHFALLAGHKGGDFVASSLSMHRRTLSRRLRAQGTTYQAALDDVRFAVATQLLSDRRITLDDIAANLGYASVNTFIRAFSRWTGVAPGSWRRERLRMRSMLSS